MNDPHVESLEYRFVSDPTRVYDNPPPLEGEGSDFAWRLADGLLTVTMKDHYAKEGEARSVVDGFVRGWELDLALKYGRREVHFEYQRANMIDRAPTPGLPCRARAVRRVGDRDDGGRAGAGVGDVLVTRRSKASAGEVAWL